MVWVDACMPCQCCGFLVFFAFFSRSFATFLSRAPFATVNAKLPVYILGSAPSVLPPHHSPLLYCPECSRALRLYSVSIQLSTGVRINLKYLTTEGHRRIRE